MSEVIGTATIYGTFAESVAYIADRYGARYRAWEELDQAVQKQTEVNAADYLNRKSWVAAADTFAKRDALQDAEGRYVFRMAAYELGVLVADDEDVTTPADQGSNVERIDGGPGIGVTFFNPTSARSGSAPSLPPVLMSLVGKYLSASTSCGPQGGSGQSGSSVNPFSRCRDDERKDPWQ